MCSREWERQTERQKENGNEFMCAHSKEDWAQENNKNLSTRDQRKSWSQDHCKQSPWDPDWLGKLSELNSRENQSRTCIKKGKRIGLEKKETPTESFQAPEWASILEGEWKQGEPGNGCSVQRTCVGRVATDPSAPESWGQSLPLQWPPLLFFLLPLPGSGSLLCLS